MSIIKQNLNIGSTVLFSFYLAVSVTESEVTCLFVDSVSSFTVLLSVGRGVNPFRQTIDKPYLSSYTITLLLFTTSLSIALGRFKSFANLKSLLAAGQMISSKS